MTPLSVLIVFPWLALVVAGCFAGLYWKRRRVSALVAAVLWAAYGVYESLMYLQVLCSGECNIRVDLLVLYPVLLVASVWAVVAGLLRRRG